MMQLFLLELEKSIKITFIIFISNLLLNIIIIIARNFRHLVNMAELKKPREYKNFNDLEGYLYI